MDKERKERKLETGWGGAPQESTRLAALGPGFQSQHSIFKTLKIHIKKECVRLGGTGRCLYSASFLF